MAEIDPESVRDASDILAGSSYERLADAIKKNENAKKVVLGKLSDEEKAAVASTLSDEAKAAVASTLSDEALEKLLAERKKAKKG